MTHLLSEVQYDQGSEYRFKLTGDLVVYLNKGLRGFHELKNNGTVWAILNNDKLTILAGYAFDGCSPAWRFLGRWYGTPTPRAVVPAAAVHDCLRQFMGVKCLGYDRKLTDDIFHDMLREAGFPATSIYHGAVAGFWGSLFIKLTRKNSDAHCGKHPKRA